MDFQSGLFHIDAATGHRLSDTTVIVCAMDGKAVPAKLAVVFTETKWLVGVLDRCKADLAQAILTGFTINFEVNGIHISEQVLT